MEALTRWLPLGITAAMAAGAVVCCLLATEVFHSPEKKQRFDESGAAQRARLSSIFGLMAMSLATLLYIFYDISTAVRWHILWLSLAMVLVSIVLGGFVIAPLLMRLLYLLSGTDYAAKLGDDYYDESLDRLLDGGPKAGRLALKWYRAAAERGHPQLKSQQLRLEKVKAKEPWLMADGYELCCYAAERGHQHAFSELMYRGRSNHRKNPTLYCRDAFYWTCRNAKLGNLQAENHLGAMYSMGIGTHQNDELAVRWYREAAVAGCPEAEFNLGHMYESGLGVGRNFAEAAIWYHRAALVLPRARTALAEMYAKGRGVRKDFVKAYTWAGLAIVKGNKAARRDYFERELTPEQIHQAKRKIAKWNPFAPWSL